MSENQKISLKTINMKTVFDLLYQEGSLSQTEIRERTGLSGPTVSACLQYFRKNDIFIDGKELASSGGRKPRLVTFNYNIRYAVGIEIRKNHIDICILNMKGKLISNNTHRVSFSHDEAYWNKVSVYAEKEIEEHVDRSKVIGIGIAFPGEISLDGQKIMRATVFGLKNIPISDIQRHFKLPIKVEYGPNAAGFGISYRNVNMPDCVCIVVTNNGVAGAIINDHKIFRGKTGEPGAFGHIVLDDKSKEHFSGSRYSTWSTVCAVTELTQQEDPDLAAFFSRYENKDKQAVNSWNEYVRYMARGLAIVKLSFDSDIVIAGRIAPYLEKYYSKLKKEFSKYPAFNDEGFDVLIDTTSASPMAEGAGMLLIASFVNNYIEKEYE